jgi:hypothetical protein
MLDLAVDLVLAVMGSASTDKIRPIDWWPRAKTALEASAGAAVDFEDLLSRMANKLCIETYTESSAVALAEIKEEIEAFRPFASYCRQQAIAIVATAQAKRAKQKLEAKEVF